jgi:uncharacterized tellurite resistance protein B-like protein
MKLLNLRADEIYHIFCLALAVADIDGSMTDMEGETLTRIGFGLGLSPGDISALSRNAKEAMEKTSRADFIAFSLTSLKQRLTMEQLSGVKQIIRFVAGADRKIVPEEKALLNLVNELWTD